MGRGSASIQGSADRTEVETLTQSGREWGAGMRAGHRAEQDRSGCKPHPKCPGLVCSGQKLRALDPFTQVLSPRPEQQPTGLGEGALTQYPGHAALLY